MPIPQDEEQPPTGPVTPPAPTGTRKPNNLLERYPYKDPNNDSGVPYAAGEDTYASPPDGAATPTEETPWSRRPRHLTIYGGRGYNEDGTLRDPAEEAASGSGGGSGGGGTKSSSSTSTTTPPDFGLGSTILDGINRLLSQGAGWDIDRMKQQLLISNKGQTAANEEALLQDAIRRGVFRSGITSGNVAKNRRAATADYTQGVNQLYIDKAKADFDARLKGLELAQRHVDSARDYLLRSDANQIQREIGWAQIRLGQDRINLEREALAKQGKGGGGGDDIGDILNLLGGLGLFGGNSPAPTPPGT